MSNSDLTYLANKCTDSQFLNGLGSFMNSKSANNLSIEMHPENCF